MMQKFKNIFHLFQAVIANIFYGFPSRKIKVIGVTGTDGKTTTTQLIHHILKSAGYKASMISTVSAQIADRKYDTGFHVTTPDPFFIQKMLRQAVDHGDKYFVLETTSHALDQNRVWGVKYELGVLTNVTHEHLDYHKNYGEYLEAKLKLLKKAKVAIVNGDDESYKNVKCQMLNVKCQKYNSKLKILNNFTDLTEYNKYNYSAAYTVCKVLGISDEKILAGMKSFKLPTGRLNIVYDKEFKVIIDFAHTPNAFEQVLPSVRNFYLKPGGRLIHVFGSAGLRDASKRPLMGEASGKNADIVILTEEDYRTENIKEICKSISQGLEKMGFVEKKFFIANNRTKYYQVILNRQEAVNKAISLAKRGDLVICTGKGHEKSLCRGKIEYPWDEYEAVKRALQLKLKTQMSNVRSI